MTDYSELVKALRVCNRIDHVGNCNECYYGSPDAPPPKQYVNGCKRSMCEDAADAIEDLQAEVNRLELDNEDYEHEQRRLKGEIEALQAQLPKRGEWVEDTTTYAGPGLSNYKCSLCGKICGTWRSGLKPSELPNWCGNCGAYMRKMEVQE